MDYSWLFLVNVGIGVLVTVLGIPMMQGKVKPNRVYGFRTKKTLSDENVWYATNKYAGKQMVGWGLVTLLVSLGFYLVNMQTGFAAEYTEAAMTGLWAILLCVPLVLMVIVSLVHLRKY